MNVLRDPRATALKNTPTKYACRALVDEDATPCARACCGQAEVCRVISVDAKSPMQLIDQSKQENPNCPCFGRVTACRTEPRKSGLCPDCRYSAMWFANINECIGDLAQCE